MNSYHTFSTPISEMESTPTSELVKVDKKLIEEVSKGDDKPMFVTLQILREGVSKSKRNYSREVVESVVEQINEKLPNGYQGHLKEEELATAAPDPLIMWLGAELVEEDGKATAYAKGYVMPDEKKFRTYLTKAKAAGKNVAMSIQAKADAVKDQATQVFNIRNLNLSSVDFARDGSEGVPNNGKLILASEMVENNNSKDKDTDMKREEVIQSLTVSEMEQHNKTLVSEIKESATDKELVSEMEATKKLTGDKAPSAYIAEMQAKVQGMELKQSIATKVKAKDARGVIENMVVTEMANVEGEINVAEMVDSVLDSVDGKAVMSRFTHTEPKISAKNSKRESKPTGSQYATTSTVDIN